jgi:hypothetical protein
MGRRHSTDNVLGQVNQRGEELFASFLDQSEIPYTYEPLCHGRSRRPDFLVPWRDTECFFEVKDRQIESGRTFTLEDFATLSMDSLIPEREPPYRWIRNKIEKVRTQLSEFKGSPCALVLYPASGFSSDFDSPDFMLGAMYGDVAIQMRSESTPDTLVFLDGGKMLMPGSRTQQNTTISALITLRSVDVGAARRRQLRRLGVNPLDLTLVSTAPSYLLEERLGVIVWENVFAAKPLPADLFVGPFDERWGLVGNSIQRVHFGSGLAEVFDAFDCE